MALFSVLMSTFECWGAGPDFTRQHLQSIVDQTHRPLQCVISDHSKDDEIEKVVKSIDPKGVDVIYVRFDRDYGNPASNWNNALAQATGEYLQYVSMDDWYHDPTAIERMVAFFDENKDVEWAAVPEIVQPGDRLFYPWWPDQYVLNENTLGGPGAVIFRSSLRDVKWEERLIYFADDEWYYRMFVAAKKPPYLYKGPAVYTCRHHPFQQQKVRGSDVQMRDLDMIMSIYGTFRPNHDTISSPKDGGAK